MKSFLLIFTLLTLTACTSNSPVTSYYVGDGNLQFFVSSSEFPGPEGSKLSCDFSYRRNSEKSPIIVNLSYFTRGTLPADLPGVWFSQSTLGLKIELSEVNLLFKEKKQGHLRFTGLISERDFLSLVETPGWEASLLFSDTQTLKFPPSSHFDRHMNALKDEL